MVDCKPVTTPMSNFIELIPEVTLKGDEVFKQPYPYRELVGALQYLVRGSRPDIANAVRVLSKYLICYNKTHFEAAKRVLKYLKHTLTYGLLFDGTDESGPDSVSYQVFTDASFADPPDRHSTTGWIILMANCAIAIKSGAQKLIALSTTNAETIALSDGIREGEYFRHVLSELGLVSQKPYRVWCDNKASIDMVRHIKNNPSTKHINIKELFVRELQSLNIVDVVYCLTEEMLADIFTKVLPKEQFEKLRSKIGVRDLSELIINDQKM